MTLKRAVYRSDQAAIPFLCRYKGPASPGKQRHSGLTYKTQKRNHQETITNWICNDINNDYINLKNNPNIKVTKSSLDNSKIKRKLKENPVI